MKRYAALIRKLVDATAEADSYGADVAEILKQRCFNETSIVRCGGYSCKEISLKNEQMSERPAFV